MKKTEKRIYVYSDIYIYMSVEFSRSVVSLCDPMNCSTQASLSITNSRSLLKLMSIKSVMPSNHLILCLPLLLLPSIFPRIRVFSSELALRIRWPKHWSYSFSISPSNEYLGLVSFRTDWFDLLVYTHTHTHTHTHTYVYMNLPAVQETWVQSLGQEQSPGEGNGYPLQYSCLENFMDTGAW